MREIHHEIKRLNVEAGRTRDAQLPATSRGSGTYERWREIVHLAMRLGTVKHGRSRSRVRTMLIPGSLFC